MGDEVLMSRAVRGLVGDVVGEDIVVRVWGCRRNWMSWVGVFEKGSGYCVVC